MAMQRRPYPGHAQRNFDRDRERRPPLSVTKQEEPDALFALIQEARVIFQSWARPVPMTTTWDNLGIRMTPTVNALYPGSARDYTKCVECGLRITYFGLDAHMAAHATKKCSAAAAGTRSRAWFAPTSRWIAAGAREQGQIEAQATPFFRPPPVQNTAAPVCRPTIAVIDCDSDRCTLCRDKFDEECDDDDVWVFLDAVRHRDGRVYHAICIPK